MAVDGGWVGQGVDEKGGPASAMRFLGFCSVGGRVLAHRGGQGSVAVLLWGKGGHYANRPPPQPQLLILDTPHRFSWGAAPPRPPPHFQGKMQKAKAKATRKRQKTKENAKTKAKAKAKGEMQYGMQRQKAKAKADCKRQTTKTKTKAKGKWQRPNAKANARGKGKGTM